MNFLLLALFISLQGLSQDKLSNGNGVGNGGDAVVCRDSVELLDFTEARLLKRFNLIAPGKTLGHVELAKSRLAKLEKLDKRLFEQYSKVLSLIEPRWKFIENAEFRDVADSFEIALPEGCQIVQLAIQQVEDGKTVFHVSKKIWAKLDPRSKAGLLLHEIVYEHFLLLGDVNSVKARKFTSFLFSQEIDRYDQIKYKVFIRDLGVKFY
ncbi:MAG TPA: hypothetical protein VNJ01_18015 [Bacteriovoracaceae bacterium]|nr:hypothetical protein [Bacteriovoracaceae bacterium]